MLRIVHTADVHLDTCFAGAGISAASGNRRRQSLRDAFHGVVARAGEWPADALLIAGDLFESDRVSRDTVAFVIAELASIPHVPVFITPGNHDPYTPTSVFATETWPENVTIFSSPNWHAVTVPDRALTVHGFAFDGPSISSNPFGALTLDDHTDTVHVAIGHGTEKGHQPPDKAEYAPFDAASMDVPGLAYLALGHFHKLTPLEGDYKTKMYYSGSPEGHSHRETGDHYHLEVEIDNGETKVTPVISSRVVYTSPEIDCDAFESSQDLVRALRAIAEDNERKQIARVTLKGACAIDLGSELDSAHDAVAPDFESLELINRTETQFDFDELAREETSLGIFVRTMNEEIADVAEEGRRQMLVRARELGVSAFQGRTVSIRGLERSES